MLIKFPGLNAASLPRAAVVLCLAAGAMVATAAYAQSWDYKSYRRDKTSGQYDKDRFLTATIKLEEKDGAATFQMISPGLDVCYRRPLPATVEKTAETTTITVTQPVSGCEEFRYIIRNDGSGGIKETKRGERWAKSPFDHGLTPAK